MSVKIAVCTQMLCNQIGISSVTESKPFGTRTDAALENASTIGFGAEITRRSTLLTAYVCVLFQVRDFRVGASNRTLSERRIAAPSIIVGAVFLIDNYSGVRGKNKI